MHPIFEERVHQALLRLPEGLTPLQVITKLGQEFPAELARAAAGLFELRKRATKRFPTMTLYFLSQKGLAQASSELVARWRGARVSELAPGKTICDMTCGIGADSLGLALHGVSIVSADLDFEHLQFARANLQHHGFPGHVLRADAAFSSAKTDLCLIDPDRRKEGRRVLDPADWSPSLEQSLKVAKRHLGACLKLAPAMDPELLQQAENSVFPRDLPRQREWLSRSGELVELCLWTGVLAQEDPAERVATRLDREGHQVSFSGSPLTVPPLSTEQAKAVKWIGDPDPALLRAGLLGNLAQALNLAPLAGQIAYLGGEERPNSPFLRTWEVLGSVPIDRKRIRSLLREHDIGPISVRKRGHPEKPEALERKFRGKGKQRGHLLIARLTEGHRAYLVQPSALPGSTNPSPRVV